MAACSLADGLVAFAYSQGVSESVLWLQVLLLIILRSLPALRKYVNCFMVSGPLADGLVTFACSQPVSELVSWFRDLLLIVLGHLPAFRK